MKTLKSARALILQNRHTAQILANRPEPEAPAVTAPLIAMRIFKVLVPLFCVLFTWAHALAFIYTLRISILIILAKAVLEIQFYVRRSTAPFVSTSAWAWLIALCGTAAPLMLRPTDDTSDSSVATVIQVIGLAMQVYLITTLNRNLGSTIARRGISSDGLYRFVRHPIHLAFMLGQYGYVLNHATFYNACVLAFVTLFQVLRINEEERLLRDDDAFQGYAQRTHWRLVPGMF